jgi:hypothetical protein
MQAPTFRPANVSSSCFGLGWTPTVQIVTTLHVLIDELQFDIQWAILSHSWGTDRSLISTLTSSNMTQMQGRIDESTLCPSFRDAIAVTGGLSLQYIWIDAMCIIQDSSDDWHAESSCMCDYYQGSQVMISAVSSTSAADHMLHARDHGPMAAIDYQSQRLRVRRLLEHAAIVIPYLNSYWSVRQDVAHRPLRKRAWTYQEYTMAPRILHFTRGLIVWQCTTCIAPGDNQYNMFDNEPSPLSRKYESANGLGSLIAGLGSGVISHSNRRDGITSSKHTRPDKSPSPPTYFPLWAQ